MAGKIFINYRRDDAPDSAGFLDYVLEQEFSREVVFKDVDSIELGEDFEAALSSEVADCDVFLAVIGPKWQDLVSARSNDRKDFVRVEIKAALDQGKRVIPVLVQGADMPTAANLPKDIESLATRNAIRLRPERFTGDAQGLVAGLHKALKEAEEERQRSEAERAAAEEARKAKEAEEARQKAEAEKRAAEQAAAGLSADEIRKAEELANWDFIKSRDDVAEHRDHLARFPGGVTELYARTALSELVWKTLGDDASAEQLKDYLDEFPKGPHADAAKQRLSMLEQEASRLEKEAARQAAIEKSRQDEVEKWAKVAASDKTEDIDAFLKEWPHGVHAASARARLKELRGQDGISRRRMVGNLGITIGLAGAASGITAAAVIPGAPIWRWRLDQSVRTLSGHTAPITALGISPDGERAVSYASWPTYQDTQPLRVWDLETGEHLRTLDETSCKSLAVTPDGQFAIGCFWNGAIVFDMATGKQIGHFKEQTHDLTLPTNDVVIAPDGGHALTSGHDKTLMLWEIDTQKLVKTFVGHTGPVEAADISQDGRHVVSVRGYQNDDFEPEDGIIVWDFASASPIRRIRHRVGDAVAFSPDGKLFATADTSALKLRETASGRVVATLSTRSSRGDDGYPSTIAMTPDGRHVIAASYDDAIRIYEISSTKLVREFTGHTSQVYQLAITRDGRTLVSGSHDTTIKVWDLSFLA